MNDVSSGRPPLPPSPSPILPRDDEGDPGRPGPTAPGGPEEAAPAGEGRTARRRPGRARRLAGLAGMAVLAAALVASFTVPMPYVVEGPGPTFDVTGSSDGTPMIEISGTDPSTGQAVSLDPVRTAGDGTGELRMVTVSEQGGPGQRLNLVQLIEARLDRRDVVVPYDEAYPGDVTQEDVTRAGQAQMESSQSTAEVSALEYLGWDVPATMTVEGAVAGSDAEGKVQQGDVLVSLTTPDGQVHAVDSASVPFSVMRGVPVGSTVLATMTRDGEQVAVPIVTSAGDDGSQGSKLGVYLSADVDLPVDITVNLEKVGGPSAGTMFALGIIDRMTPGDLAGGQSIAGTGAIGYDGQVQAIGGIRQKMWGAVRDGAAWFLAPSANCDEVVGHVPEGLGVVKVSTLDDAVSAVKAIAAGQGDTLPTCTASDAQSGSAES